MKDEAPEVSATPTPRVLLGSRLPLRQTLLLGAALGILLPALVLAYYQMSHRLESEIELRVRLPMRQYADVLSRGVAVAIWNVDRGVANELVDAVMRNPDVLRVSVSDEHKEIFVRQEKKTESTESGPIEEREVRYNGVRVGKLTVEMTTERIYREFYLDLAKLVGGLLAQVLMSFGLIWLLLERRMMRPLQVLTQGAMRLASGKLDQPVHWDRADEMGDLARGFETMRTSLGASIADREDKNRALEAELEERSRVEQALGLSQAKSMAIFDASPIPMAVKSGQGQCLVQDVNDAWVRVFGVERSAIVGQPTTDVDQWRDRQDRANVINAIQHEGEVTRYPAWMRRGGTQEEILCEVSGRALVLGGETLMILAYDDVTANREQQAEILALNATLEQRVKERTQALSSSLHQLTVAQDELVRAEKMAALGSLVAGIAHELNTPIGNSLTVATTLQDYSEAFQLEMSKGLTRSRLDEFVKSTHEGAGILTRGLHHAADLVASFKQVAVDQTSAQKRSFNLRETMGDILLTMGPSLRKTTHTVESDIPDDLVMDSYPGSLGQVITNLVNNAVIHAFEGRTHGIVRIAASAAQPGWVLLTVRDDGRGITPANLPRIFDPFFTTKMGQGGSGLGLNIVYNLVRDALGGTIRVESEEGQGACFLIDLPLSAPVPLAEKEES